MSEPSVVAAVREFKEGLLAREQMNMATMAQRWLQVRDALEASLRDVANEVANLRALGEPVTAGKLMRMERYQKLLDQTRREIAQYGQYAEGTITSEQMRMLGQGVQHATAAIQAAQLDAGVMASFTTLAVNEVQFTAGMLADGAPLAKLLKQAYPDAVDGISRALITGIAQGQAPAATARAMAEGLDNALQRMLLISRTETLRAYRAGTLEEYRASEVVSGYRRMSAKSGRTCLACLIADGTWYDLETDFIDHPAGRCAIVPALKGGDAPTWQYGQQWFEEQHWTTQREMLGPARYDAWKAGKIRLDQLVTTKHDDTWGESLQVTPLRGLV